MSKNKKNFVTLRLSSADIENLEKYSAYLADIIGENVTTSTAIRSALAQVVKMVA